MFLSSICSLRWHVWLKEDVINWDQRVALEERGEKTFLPHFLEYMEMVYIQDLEKF